ncbi:MAG: hypothetical protein H7838_01020 [Magnetococcus sp. DMHC-8]
MSSSDARPSPRDGAAAATPSLRTRSQAGSALFLMMTLLVMVASALLLDGWRAGRSPAPVWQEHAKVLGVAREALLAFGAIRQDHPGRFPCPDQAQTGHGQASLACPSEAEWVVGWLPWHTLGLMPLRTEAGQTIGYAVATHSLASSTTGPRPAAAGVGVEVGVEDQQTHWAAVLFIPGQGPQPDPPPVWPTMLQGADALPITVAELAGVTGNDHDAHR